MDFAGYPTGVLENSFIRLEYLTLGALRLNRLHAFNSPNLFAEVPDIEWLTPHGSYRMLGGHRLWVAPEIPDLTYLPEPPELKVEKFEDGVRLTQAIDPRSNLQKIIEIILHPTEASFTLRHFLVNQGSIPLCVSAWAITQFQPGGMGAFPQPSTLADPGGYLPNRSLSLWPYTHLDDTRLTWLDHHIIMRADAQEKPCKIGCFLPDGKGYYYNQGVLICKKVSVQPAEIYPDLNSVLEMYTNHRFLELESLSPLVDLQPNNQIIHEEFFQLYSAPDIKNEHELAAMLDSLA